MTLASKTDVKQQAVITPRRISLRWFLLLIMLALSLATVGGTGLIAYMLSYRTLTELQGRAFALTNFSAANEIGDMLNDPAQRILNEFAHRAELGMMSRDSTELGRDLAERLRVRPSLAWISYSDVGTGDFTGVWRDKNSDIILNRSSPGVMPVEMTVTLDGQLTPHPRALDSLYDPRKTEWFARTLGSDRIVWSEPYLFADGKYGITASKAWRKPGAATATGIFTVDFFLSEVESSMGELSLKHGDFIFAYQPDGRLLCAPQGPLRQAFAGFLGDLVKSTPLPAPNTAYDRLYTFNRNGETYMAALYYMKTSTGLECVVASLAEKSRVYKQAHETLKIIACTGLIALAAALAIGWGIAKRISRPIIILSNDLEKVGDLDFSSGPLKKSILRELQILIEASERMKSGLRSFLHYVPTDLVRRLLHSGRDAALGVEPRCLTIFFTDIENFTGYSERVQPDKLVLDLCGYFDVITHAVLRHSGTIDKFTGDGVLAFFNAPFDLANHEQAACHTALEAINALQPAGTAGNHECKFPFRTRIGLHAGEVLVGNVGTPERFAYTVLGDVVNTSSRLESLNKIYGTHILASEDVRKKTGEEFEWRYLDRVVVAGRRGTLNLYELLGVRGGNINADLLRARDLYEKAMDVYFAQDLAKARELFAGASEARPDDKAAEVMMCRCDDLMKNHPGADWDGVFIHKHK